MSTYSNRPQPALQNLLQRVVRFFTWDRHAWRIAYIGVHFCQMKITRKASDSEENLQLYRVVQFFHPRSSCMATHISADVHASCMTISGRSTKQLYIFCRVTGFTSDFFSFIVVELIQFFHGAIQLSDRSPWLSFEARHVLENLWYYIIFPRRSSSGYGAVA